VDRDDLEDGGAGIFASTIEAVRRQTPRCIVEVLVPDFEGSAQALEVVLKAKPEILNHNMETVPRLYPMARGGGDYHRSLELLRRAQQFSPDIVTKTGMMLGLGEQEKEIHQVMHDLIELNVSILTLGQYLQPTSWHLSVARYYSPQEFQYWKEVGEAMGFQHVESGPLVRSSYLADRQFASMKTSGT
jgi:lipoic acid synthetase